MIVNLVHRISRRRTCTEPAVARSLAEAIGDGDMWSEDGQRAIRERLASVAEREWATAALWQFDSLGPDQFLRLHLIAVIDRATTRMELMRAAYELKKRAGGLSSVAEALTRLDLTEEQWLHERGFTF